MPGFSVESGQTFLFVGDSITDCGRRGEFAPLGNGYVRQVADLVRARYPERDIRFINEGIGGNAVLDLRARWSTDVLSHSPDWLSVKIGINDLHRTLGGAMDIRPAVYETAYREILERARDHCHPRMMLIDPFYMSTERSEGSAEAAVLDRLPEYIEVVHKLAEAFGALSVRTHDLFQEQLKHRAADVFCAEPVHPNPSGHMVIAHAVLRALAW